MLVIKEINNKKTWDGFLDQKDLVFYPLFQSWNWGEVQKQLGFSVVRLGVYNDKKLVAIAQLIDIKAKRGHYLHLRHGPVLRPFDVAVFAFLINHIKGIARAKGASFVRMSTVVKKDLVDYSMLTKMGFRDAPIHNMDAETCWVLDVAKPQEELLKGMRKTHRYLVRKGGSMDIKIVRTNNIDDMDKFTKLYSHLSHRKHFVPHRGVKEEFEIFAKDDQAVLFLAQLRGKTIAGCLILFVGHMAIYHHGASDEKYKDIPASYLLQWEAIREAQKRGITLYNFWGIAPEGASNHPWAGLTLFKKGFGGREIDLLHAQDLPLSPFYWRTFLIESLAKRLKGY